MKRCSWLGDTADAGFVVQSGAIRVSSEDEGGYRDVVAGPGTLIGELALVVEMQRPSSAAGNCRFLGASHFAQHVSARAGRSSRCRAQAARRSGRPDQPGGQRHDDRKRQAFSPLNVIASAARQSGVGVRSAGFRPIRPAHEASEATPFFKRRCLAMSLTPPPSPSPVHGPTAVPSRAHRARS